MKQKILMFLFCGGVYFAHAQQDTYVAPGGNIVTFTGATMTYFGNLINDAIGTTTTATTTSTGVNHNGGGTVYLYRHSTNGSGSSRIYDGNNYTTSTGKTPTPTDNYNTSGAAVRFYNLITDNNVGTATASGTTINTNGGGAHIQMEQEVRVTNQLTFTNGNIWTPRANWKHAFLHFDADGATYTGASASNAAYTSPATNMHVDGYVAKTGSSNFTFPIGDGKYARFAGLSSPTSGEYKAAYFVGDATGGTSGISGNNANNTSFSGGINRVNHSEFWDIDGTASSQFTLTALNSVTGYSNWGTTSNFSGSSAGNIVITAFDAWTNLSITGTPTALTNDGAYTTTVTTSPDATNYSAYTWASTSSVLPVKLTQFSGLGNNCDAILNWVTTSESNSSSFVLQQSGDGLGFKDIAAINASGFSNGHSYGTSVAQEISTAFYRLKMIDKDGSVAYSNIITIKGNCNSAQNFIKLYPNPSGLNKNVYLSFGSTIQGKAAVLITDHLGQEIMNKTVILNAGANVLPLDISSFTNGVYYVRVVDANGLQINLTQRLIKN